ncbi:transketolase [Klebsiella pneumoniae]|uniref:Transketolase n=1 Tax=Klebsiella pneumoniae TaxID=573 RepID=A0A2X3FDS3_KLEPN|nr:transketolase [Klebsiella pneumoniae]
MSSRKELANAIRALSMDAVQKAKSGHPGAPMGMADIAEVLWRDFLNHNRTIRPGLTVTVLCCQMAMVRC